MFNKEVCGVFSITHTVFFEHIPPDNRQTDITIYLKENTQMARHSTLYQLTSGRDDTRGGNLFRYYFSAS